MLSVILFAAAFVGANAQRALPIRDYRVNPYYDESPKPYAFSYNALLDDGVGQSSRTETADGSGRVQGSYTLNNDEGHFRVVEYVADQDGFRAVVRTNEPGTESKNPADVVFESSAVPVQYGSVYRRPALVPPVAPAVAPAVEPVSAPLPTPVRPFYRQPGAFLRRNYGLGRPPY